MSLPKEIYWRGAKSTKFVSILQQTVWESRADFPFSLYMLWLSSSTRLLLINQFSTAPRLSMCMRLSVGESEKVAPRNLHVRASGEMPWHQTHMRCELNRNAYAERAPQLPSRLIKYLPPRATHSPVPYSGKWSPIKFALAFIWRCLPNIKGQTVQANRWKIFQLSEVKVALVADCLPLSLHHPTLVC
jgi:hypothetical protein